MRSLSIPIVALACSLAYAAPVHAADKICPFRLDHVLLVEGDRDPPTAIIPDKNSGEPSLPKYWNFLNRSRTLPRVKVHCFELGAQGAEKVVALDFKYKHCKYDRHSLVCSRRPIQ